MKLPPIAHVAFGGLLGGLGLFALKIGHPPGQSAGARPPVAPPPEFQLSSTADLPLTAPTPALPEVAPATPSPVLAAERKAALVDLDNVQFMLRDFRALMHGNPEGTNAEIMKSVMGGNPNRAQLGPPPGQSVNERGELIDRWGTPYFFHQLSKDEMEIRSAGPDRKMWTSDDVVMK